MTTHVVTPEQEAEVLSNPTGDRPEGLPEEFGSVAEMAEALAALKGKPEDEENELPSSKDATKEDPKESDEKSEDDVEDDQDETPEIPDNPYGETVGKAMTDAGIDPKALATEWAEKGEINTETREKLDATFGKDMVDQYIAGWQANNAETSEEETPAEPVGPSEEDQASLRNDFGGDEKFGELISWGSDNLTDAELEFFNSQVSNTKDTAKMAIEWLDAKRMATEGFPPEVSLSGRKPTQAQSQDVYTSLEEVSRDMAARDGNGRNMYKVDKGYRAKGKARIARSSS